MRQLQTPVAPDRTRQLSLAVIVLATILLVLTLAAYLVGHLAWTVLPAGLIPFAIAGSLAARTVPLSASTSRVVRALAFASAVAGLVVASYSLFSPTGYLHTPAEGVVLVGSIATSALLLIALTREHQAKGSRRGA